MRTYSIIDALNSNLEEKVSESDLGSAAFLDSTDSVTSGSGKLLTSGGAYTALSKKLTTTALVNMYAVQQVTFSQKSVSAGTYANWSDITKTKSGYYPLAIAGFNSASYLVVPTTMFISEADEGSCTLQLTVLNTHTAAISIKPILWILWVKTS